MTKKQAETLAHDLSNSKRGIIGQVGHYKTNGLNHFVVHVTHKFREGIDRGTAYTISK